jgi:hypothetical protein
MIESRIWSCEPSWKRSSVWPGIKDARMPSSISGLMVRAAMMLSFTAASSRESLIGVGMVM